MVQAFGPITFGLAVAALSASAGGVWLSILIARKAGIMDVPNGRSSHSIPRPRMGGVPMAATAMLAFGIWAYLLAGEVFYYKGICVAMFFAFGMWALGFFDDLYGLSILFRFIIQFALCVFCLVLVWPLISGLPWIGNDWSGMLLVAVGSFWCVWFLNLYNFMDGIDGLAGGEAVIASSFFFILFAREGESAWAIANLLISAAAMGFLIFNWPPARVFMGDAGSLFLGAFYGMQSLMAPVTTGVPFIVLVLPFANFILDTTFTLLRRMFRGEKWYEAHRSHVYQKMTNLGISHRKVTFLELVALVISCVAAAACILADIYARITLMAFVIIGLACAGFWVYRKESVLLARGGNKSW